MEPVMSVMNAPLVDRRRAGAAAAVALAAAVVVVGWGGYEQGWSWTGLTDNATLWAWLRLLALPLSLASLPLWLRSHRQMAATRSALLLGAAAVFGVVVLLGYVLHWRWTGFAGNTLWDWLEVLLLPVVIATVQYWTKERVVEARHRVLVAATVVAFAVFTVCAYLLPIGWSGFAGNTLWDWIRLLLIPVLMPLVLVPAVTDWIGAGAAEAPQPAQTVTYDIWLTPQEKLTAQLVTCSGDGTIPQLVVADVHKVVANPPAAD
jgi:hypothetical protein